MALSSLSVVINANRLRRYHPVALPWAEQITGEPLVETSADRSTAEPAPSADLATDPVCGMRVDPASAAAQRGTGAEVTYFCSAHCAASYDAEPGRQAGHVA